MSAIRSFRDLKAYQKARRAAQKVFELTKRFPRDERYSLIDQIRRSSRAVSAMIAEAWGRRRYEAVFVNKLSEAQGEANESQSWLDHALDCSYIDEREHGDFNSLFQELGAMLQGMIDKADTFCGMAKK